jgi:hypothetical protein
MFGVAMAMKGSLRLSRALNAGLARRAYELGASTQFLMMAWRCAFRDRLRGYEHGRVLVAIVIALATFTTSAVATSGAEAGYKWLGGGIGEFADGGEGALANVDNGVAVNESTGRVYVADNADSKVSVYGPEGRFEESWGWGVIGSGPGIKGTAEVVEVKVEATGGKFKLELITPFGEGETSELSYNATTSEVKNALEPETGKLAFVKRVGGEITVTGGPSAYTITLGGSLQGQPVMELNTHNVSLTGGKAQITNTVKVPDEPALEVCIPAKGDTCNGGAAIGEGAGQLSSDSSIAVDKTTGYVYVLNPGHAKSVVDVFNGEGGFVTSFGESGEGSTEKIHRPESNGAIAVDASGDVYVVDEREGNGTAGGRVMEFRPTVAGDYEHYVYAGEGTDIASGKAAGSHIAVDEATEDVYLTGSKLIRKFKPGDPSTVLWEKVTAGEIESLTVDPKSEEVIFFSGEKHEFFVLNGAGEEVEKFGSPLTKPEEELTALAIDASRALEVGTPPVLYPEGTLYALATISRMGAGLNEGLIFARPPVETPQVEWETVGEVGVESASLRGGIEPDGNTTDYHFEYLSEVEYNAHHPNAEQKVDVAATGGTFTLEFNGQSTGGTGAGGVTAGSPIVSGLVTAAGTGNVSGAAGTGTLSKESETVKEVATTGGKFEKGQTISGEGIPANTTIEAVSGTTLTLSAKATVSEEKKGVALTAGSAEVTNVAMTSGRFFAGDQITGAGIPAGTTIEAVGQNSLTLSKLATATGKKGEALGSAGPLPFAVGQEIAGQGIPAGTRIVAASEGKLTLSAGATETASGVALTSGLPFDAGAGEVRRALDGLPSIGGVGGSVSVSGGPGGETGSAPYLVTFEGSLGDDSSITTLGAGFGSLTLGAGAGSVVVTIANPGGGGFTGAKTTSLETLPGALTGEDTAEHGIAGLAPNTSYRYRVVAVSHCNPAAPTQECSVDGDAGMFTTYPAGAAGLADGRGYELVSPVEKDGGEVFPPFPRALGGCEECEPGLLDTIMPMVSAANGNAVSYEGTPFSAAGDAVNENQYVAARTASGWETRDLSPELEIGNSNAEETGVKALSADLSRAVLYQTQQNGLCSGEEPAGYANLYLLGGECDGRPGPQPLVVSRPPQRAPREGEAKNRFKIEFAGASEDLSHIIFSANDALTGASASAPSAPEVPAEIAEAESVDSEDSRSDLYEHVAGGLRLVNVLPPDNEAELGEFGGGGGVFEGGGQPDYDHAISANGALIYWTDTSPGPNDGRVYVRVNGEQTVEVPGSGPSAGFLTASADGSRVLLTDGRIYQLDAAAETFSEVADLNAGGGGGDFEGILGASEDLSSVYFVDTAVLSGSQENSDGQAANAGADNLYLYRAGGGAPTFATSGVENGLTTTEKDKAATGDWQRAPEDRTAQVSSDGRYVAFESRASDTGFDNEVVSGGCERSAVKRCVEVYEYDAATGRLACASCDPSGARPTGNAELALLTPDSGYLPEPRDITENGRVFFNSVDSLAAGATNLGVQDVYEYEPEGAGTCRLTAGCVSLISSGHAGSDAAFVTASPSGSDVFFTTREQLVKADKDDLIDLYDAREPHEAGEQVEFPETSSQPPSACAGESECRPAYSPTPVFGSQPGAPPSGSGNLTPTLIAPSSSSSSPPPPPPPSPKCGKGKTLSHGKCVAVKKRAKAKKKAKKARKTARRSASRARGARGAGR